MNSPNVLYDANVSSNPLNSYSKLKLRNDYFVRIRVSVSLIGLFEFFGELEDFSIAYHESYSCNLFGLSSLTSDWIYYLVTIWWDWKGRVVFKIENIFFHFSSRLSMSPISNTLIIFLTVWTVRQNLTRFWITA